MPHSKANIQINSVPTTSDTTILATAVQLDIATADKARNLTVVNDIVSRLPGNTDLVVLPEMFPTGFITDKHLAYNLAEPTDGQIVTTIRELALHHHTAIVAPIIAIGADNLLYNRCYFIDDSGEIRAYYDKRHLFSIGAETGTFTPGGQAMPVVNYRGFNIALAICYDLRFPTWLRNSGLRYDILAVVANWPDSRAYAWQQLLIARAIENQAYVIGCNRSGSDDWGTYSGTSSILSPKGIPISKSYDNIVSATLNLDELKSFRQKFPVYLDADCFEIQL